MKRMLALVLAMTLLLIVIPVIAEGTGIWEEHEYVDEFGDPTGEWFISTTVKGTFSNTATNNSSARMQLLTDKESFAIELYEYDNILVTNIFDEIAEYTISIKDADGVVHRFTAKQYKSRIYLYDGNDNFIPDGSVRSGDNRARAIYEELIPIFENGGQIKISITHGNSHYVFTCYGGTFKTQFYFAWGKTHRENGKLKLALECLQKSNHPSIDEEILKIFCGCRVGSIIQHKSNGSGTISALNIIESSVDGIIRDCVFASVAWDNGTTTQIGLDVAIQNGYVEVLETPDYDESIEQITSETDEENLGLTVATIADFQFSDGAVFGQNTDELMTALKTNGLSPNNYGVVVTLRDELWGINGILMNDLVGQESGLWKRSFTFGYGQEAIGTELYKTVYDELVESLRQPSYINGNAQWSIGIESGGKITIDLKPATAHEVVVAVEWLGVE